MPKLKPASRVGAYEVVGPLGSGGMGDVYLARHESLERYVALKLLTNEGEPARYERFLREAQAVAKLDHPNIVRVYDYGHHEGRPFIAMEYISGDTLLRYIRNPKEC